MNTLDMHTKEFQKWWLFGKTCHDLSKDSAYQGWLVCISQRYLIQGLGNKCRGTDAYSCGWNAAVDFIINNTED